MKRTTATTWPFTYETDAAAIREALARNAESVAIERRCVARCLKNGQNPRLHRRGIDRMEAMRRAGETRLRMMGAA